MSWSPCPICDHRNPASAIRCTACGAAFDDPDVRTLAGLPPVADLAPAGGLSSSRFLGVSLDGLGEPAALGRVARIAAVLLLVAALLPMSPDFQGLDFVWSHLGARPLALGLTFAVLLALIGAGWIDRLARPAFALAAVLSTLGMVLLPALGHFGGAPQAVLPLHAIGLVVAGAALIVRLARPGAAGARVALGAGALLAAVGLFLDLGDGGGLPIELGGRRLAEEASTGGAYLALLQLEAANPFILFGALALFLPVVAALTCAVLAWPRPSGPWDRAALALRPLGWLIVLHAALFAAELAFNMTGWSDPAGYVVGDRYVRGDDLMSGAIAGRLRMGAIGALYSLIACVGLASLALGRADRTVPPAATSATR